MVQVMVLEEREPEEMSFGVEYFESISWMISAITLHAILTVPSFFSVNLSNPFLDSKFCQLHLGCQVCSSTSMRLVTILGVKLFDRCFKPKKLFEGSRVSKYRKCLYQHLQRGAKWFLKGFNSPSLSV